MIEWNNDPEWLRRMLNEVKGYNPGKGAIALDIGMNLGAWSMLNYKNFGCIYAFEPSFDSYHRATSILRSFEVTNVYPYNLAVCETAGDVVTLKQHPRHGRSGNARINQNWGSQSESVYTINLSAIYSLIGTNAVDYIKMDVEGAEWDILMGGLIDRVKTISLERHPWIGPEKQKAVTEWLSNDHKLIKQEADVETWQLK